MLKEFARDEKNGKRGVMVAFREGNEIKIGYSFVHPVDKEKADVERMEKMAIGRANTQDRKRNIHNNKEEIAAFVSRANRFFNNPNPEKNPSGPCDLPAWAKALVAGDSI